MSTPQTVSWNPVWEEIYQSRAWGKYPQEHVIRFVARHFQKKPVARLLDLGCGPGACSWFMAREGFEVSAIDGSPTAIQQAAARLRGEGLHADFRVGDYLQLPWDAGYFDGVIENATFYCNRFESILAARDEVARVLKPGGRFLSCNFTNRTWGHGLGDELEPNGFTNIAEGPFEGKGFALLMDRPQLDRLYSIFDDVRVETASWTLQNMTKTIELWIVDAAKPE